MTIVIKWGPPNFPLWVYLQWFQFCSSRPELLFTHFHLTCSCESPAHHPPLDSAKVLKWVNQATKPHSEPTSTITSSHESPLLYTLKNSQLSHPSWPDLPPLSAHMSHLDYTARVRKWGNQGCKKLLGRQHCRLTILVKFDKYRMRSKSCYNNLNMRRAVLSEN